MQGWVPGGFIYGSDGFGPRIYSPANGWQCVWWRRSQGIGSPAFAVIPGQKYRLTYRVYNGSGSGASIISYRIIYQSTYAATKRKSHLRNRRFPRTSSRCPVEVSTTTPTSYSYDWTGPAGMYYASMVMYAHRRVRQPTCMRSTSHAFRMRPRPSGVLTSPIRTRRLTRVRLTVFHPPR